MIDFECENLDIKSKKFFSYDKLSESIRYHKITRNVEDNIQTETLFEFNFLKEMETEIDKKIKVTDLKKQTLFDK